MPSNTAPTEVSKDNIYGARFWTAYVANLLLVSANAITFRFADFVSHLNGSEFTSGTIVSFGVVGAVYLRLFSGGWMDRFGISRVWLAGGLTMLVGLGLILTSTDIGWELFAGRLAFASGLATLFSCSMAHIQNEAPASHRTEVIASLGSSGFLGLMIGTVVADVIYRLLPGPTDATFRALFAASLVTGAIYFCLVAWLTSGDERPDATEKTPPAWSLLRRYFPGPVIACGFFMGGAFAVSSTFLTRFAHARGFSGISWFFVAYALSAFVFRVVSRTWSRKVGRHSLILIGMMAQGVGFIAIPFVRAEWHLSLPAIAIGFGHALLFPAVVSLGTATYPVRYRGTGTTLILGTFDLGQLVLAPIVGLLIDTAGFAATLYTTGAFAIVTASGYAWLTRGIVDNDGATPATGSTAADPEAADSIGSGAGEITPYDRCSEAVLAESPTGCTASAED